METAPDVDDVVLLHSSFQRWGGAEALVATHARLLAGAGFLPACVALRRGLSPDAPGEFGAGVRTPRHFNPLDLLLEYQRPHVFTARRAATLARLWRSAPTVLAYNEPAHLFLGLGPDGPRKLWQCNEPARRVHVAAANPIGFARAQQFLARGETAPDAATRSLAARIVRLQRPHVARRTAKLLAVEARAVARLDAVWSISEFARDSARRAVGRCDDRPIPPIVEAPPDAARVRRSDAATETLVVSRLETQKNVDTLIRGFARFAARRPAARLHVVGGGPEAAALRALADAEAPPETVVFHGRSTDAELAALRARCGVFAAFPVDEPFGMVFAEAALAGQVVVGPDHGGPREILEDGRYGVVADAFAPEALAAALERAHGLGDAEAALLRARAREACLRRYAASVVVPVLAAAIRGGATAGRRASSFGATA